MMNPNPPLHPIPSSESVFAMSTLGLFAVFLYPFVRSTYLSGNGAANISLAISCPFCALAAFLSLAASTRRHRGRCFRVAAGVVCAISSSCLLVMVVGIHRACGKVTDTTVAVIDAYVLGMVYLALGWFLVPLGNGGHAVSFFAQLCMHAVSLNVVLFLGSLSAVFLYGSFVATALSFAKLVDPSDSLGMVKATGIGFGQAVVVSVELVFAGDGHTDTVIHHHLIVSAVVYSVVCVVSSVLYNKRQKEKLLR